MAAAPPVRQAPSASPAAIRDAATLLLLDRTAFGVRVLMGRRRDDLAFAPGVYVFPGGRCEANDGRVRPAGDLSEATRARLLERMRGRPSVRRARGLAVAALRETAEETGFRWAGASAPPGASGLETFDAAGLPVDLSPLRLVGRAITPAGRPRRFDARFFAAFTDEGRLVPPDAPPPYDGELSAIGFVALAAVRDRPLLSITALMLSEVEARLTADPHLEAPAPVPFYLPRGRHGHSRVLIGDDSP